jgi:hypothetical protein
MVGNEVPCGYVFFNLLRYIANAATHTMGIAMSIIISQGITNWAGGSTKVIIVVEVSVLLAPSFTAKVTLYVPGCL